MSPDFPINEIVHFEFGDLVAELFLDKLQSTVPGYGLMITRLTR